MVGSKRMEVVEEKVNEITDKHCWVTLWSGGICVNLSLPVYCTKKLTGNEANTCI